MGYKDLCSAVMVQSVEDFYLACEMLKSGKYRKGWTCVDCWKVLNDVLEFFENGWLFEYIYLHNDVVLEKLKETYKELMG